MDEFVYVRSALIEAAGEHDEGFSEGQINRNRSRNFIATLARMLRDHTRNPDIWVFSRDCATHRFEFGLNELLYDILVCEVGSTTSPRHSKALTFVRRALWQIESEFAADAREAIFDFNKLVLGAAPNKLFIGPKTDNDEAFLESLFPAARSCCGAVYAALVPRPADWPKQPLEVTFWRANSERWARVQI